MRKVISTTDAPAALGPYSQGIVVGHMLFTSGQVAIDPQSNKMNHESLEQEVHQIMKNLGNIAKEAGTSLGQVVKTTIYLTDLNNYGVVNELYAGYFEADAPARSTVEVSKLPAGANVEIDMIIYVPS